MKWKCVNIGTILIEMLVSISSSYDKCRRTNIAKSRTLGDSKQVEQCLCLFKQVDEGGGGGVTKIKAGFISYATVIIL